MFSLKEGQQIIIAEVTLIGTLACHAIVFQ